ncbi:33026_t:CDS:1, partial [Racocetra persica]
LIKIIQQESYEYRDPITEFIESLYVKFDFEGAQHKLKECEEVLSNDFFLVATKMEFIENANITFLIIHHTSIHRSHNIPGRTSSVS